jgi:MFS family permease
MKLLNKVKPHSTLNYVLNIIDGTFFSFALVFISFNTILPVFIRKLGGSNLVISFIPFILTLGVSLPQLFIANYTEKLDKKKPMVAYFGIGQRLPWIIMAAGCVLLGKNNASLLIFITLMMVSVYALSSGFLIPAWFDMFTRIVPVTLRGRVMSIRMVIAQLLGIVGALSATKILNDIAYPYNYALLFLICSGFMVMSFLFFLTIAEPVEKKKTPNRDMLSFLLSVPIILKEDKNYRNFIISRGLSDLATSVTAFYSIYAINHFRLSEGYAGIFTTISSIAFVVANLTFGFLGDRKGHKLNLSIGLGATILIGIIAVFTDNLYLYLIIFMLASVAQGAKDVSMNSLTVEFCSPEKVPTYIALSSVIIVPVSLIVLAMGSIADLFGYKPLFIIALISASLGSFIMSRVKDPRKV